MKQWLITIGTMLFLTFFVMGVVTSISLATSMKPSRQQWEYIAVDANTWVEGTDFFNRPEFQERFTENLNLMASKGWELDKQFINGLIVFKRKK